MKLDKEEQDKLEEYFRTLNEDDTNYVVLRKYESLPKSVEGDVDLLVENVDHAVERGLELGFKKNKVSFISNLINIFIKCAKNPLKMINTALKRPYDSFKRILNDDIGTPNVEAVNENKIYFKDVMLHLLDRPHHKSTMNNSRIPANDRIVESYLKNYQTIEKNGFVFNKPSKVDELSHLICRGVFDYEGNFPDYYRNKSIELWEDLTYKDKKRLKQILKEVFFNANKLVIDSLEKEDLQNLRNNLRSYSNY